MVDARKDSVVLYGIVPRPATFARFTGPRTRDQAATTTEIYASAALQLELKLELSVYTQQRYLVTVPFLQPGKNVAQLSATVQMPTRTREPVVRNGQPPNERDGPR